MSGVKFRESNLAPGAAILYDAFYNFSQLFRANAGMTPQMMPRWVISVFSETPNYPNVCTARGAASSTRLSILNILCLVQSDFCTTLYSLSS